MEKHTQALPNTFFAHFFSFDVHFLQIQIYCKGDYTTDITLKGSDIIFP
jgi:hypothetical protein